MLILRGHTGPVRCLAYSPDGATLASGCDDGKVKLWYVHSGRQRRTLTVAPRRKDWVRAVAFTPDGKTLGAGDWNGCIRLWGFNSDSWFLRAGEGKTISYSYGYKELWSMTCK
jgi:WD40 repeat protein